MKIHIHPKWFSIFFALRKKVKSFKTYINSNIYFPTISNIFQDDSDLILGKKSPLKTPKFDSPKIDDLFPTSDRTPMFP